MLCSFWTASSSAVLAQSTGRRTVLGGFSRGFPCFPRCHGTPGVHQTPAEAKPADAASHHTTGNSPPKEGVLPCRVLGCHVHEKWFRTCLSKGGSKVIFFFHFGLLLICRFQVLKACRLTESWRRRQISNFQYIMALNVIAGRSFNDISQYPVFPWVLADYTSSELDLNNPASFRDLSRPMGALSEQRRRLFLERYSDDCFLLLFRVIFCLKAAIDALSVDSRACALPCLQIRILRGRDGAKVHVWHALQQRGRSSPLSCTARSVYHSPRELAGTLVVEWR